MQRFVKYATTLALLGAFAPAAASAQDTEPSTFFKAPVFVLQPGGVTTNAISAPEGLDTQTSFNARFATVLPSASPWFLGVFGAQVATGGHAGTPNIFYGGIIPIAALSSATGGMLNLSIDPLGVTTFGGTNGTFFFMEAAFTFQVGRMMFANMSPMWSGLGIYFLIDQQVSGPLPRDEEGNKDRFRPILLYGLNIPLGFGK